MKTKTNKKFLSLILAISMTLTSFAGLAVTTAGAAVEPALSKWDLEDAIHTEDFSTWAEIPADEKVVALGSNNGWNKIFYNNAIIAKTGANANGANAKITNGIMQLHNGHDINWVMDDPKKTVDYTGMSNADYIYYKHSTASYDGKTIYILVGDSYEEKQITGTTAVASNSTLTAATETAETFITIIDQKSSPKMAYTYKENGTYVSSVELGTDTVKGIRVKGHSSSNEERWNNIHSMSFGVATEHVTPTAPAYKDIKGNEQQKYILDDGTDKAVLDSNKWTSGRTATTTTGTLASDNSITKASDKLSFVYNRWVQYNQKPDSGMYYYKYKVRLYNQTANNQLVTLVGNNKEYTLAANPTITSGYTDYDYITVIDIGNEAAFTYNYNESYIATTDFHGDEITGIRFANIENSNSNNTFQIFKFSYGIYESQAADPIDLAINYENETINTTIALEYSADNKETWIACTANMAVTDFGWNGTAEKTVYFRTAASGTTQASEGNASVTIPVRPSAPTVTQYTIVNENGTEQNGAIKKSVGATNDLEYYDDTAKEWKTLDTTGVTGLEKGNTVQIRIKGVAEVKEGDTVTTAGVFPSAATTVTVGRISGVSLDTDGGAYADAGDAFTTYVEGAVKTLPTGLTKTGYTFGNWYDKSDNGKTPITAIPDTATGDKSYKAIWTAKNYTITNSAADDGEGNTTKNGYVTVAANADYKSTVTITLVPNNTAEYVLDSLTVTGTDEISTTKVSDTEYTFEMPNEAVTVDASFKEKTYTVVATAGANVTKVTLTRQSDNKSQTVSVSEGKATFTLPKGTYDVSAEFETSYVLDSATSDNTYEITADAASNAFTVNAKTATDPTIEGTVSIKGTPTVGQTLTADTNITSTGDGAVSYQWKAKGTDDAEYQNIGTNAATYTLTKAEEGKTIIVVVTKTGYSGSLTSAATDIVAPKTYTVKGTVGAGVASVKLQKGSDTPITGNVSEGVITFTNVLEGTYTVVVEKESSYKSASSNPATITVNDTNAAAYAENAFAATAIAYANPTVTIETYDTDKGTVTVTGGAATITTGSTTAKETDTITVTSAAKTGYTKATLKYKEDGDAEYKDVPANGEITVGIKAITIQATYSTNTYNIAKTTVTGGSITVNATAEYGSSVPVSLTPDTGYEAGAITVTGRTSSDNIPVTSGSFTMPAEDVTVSATFKAVTPADPKSKLSYWTQDDNTLNPAEGYPIGFGDTGAEAGLSDKWTPSATTNNQVWVRAGNGGTANKRVLAIANGHSAALNEASDDAVFYYTYSIQSWSTNAEQKHIVKLDGVDGVLVSSPLTSTSARETYTTVVDPVTEKKAYTYSADGDLVSIVDLGGSTVTGISFINNETESKALWIDDITYGTIGKTEPTVPKLTISYDTSKGAVTATAASQPINSGDEVAAEASVTVTVSANENYEVDTFTVGGEDKKSELSGGSYTFTMPDKDVAIAVTFKSTGGDEPTDPKATLSYWTEQIMTEKDENTFASSEEEATALKSKIVQELEGTEAISDWTFESKNSNGSTRADNTRVSASENGELIITYDGAAIYTRSAETGAYYYKYTISMNGGESDGANQTVSLTGIANGTLFASPSTGGTFTTVISPADKKAYTYDENGVLVSSNTITIADGEKVEGIEFRSSNNSGKNIKVSNFSYGLIADAKEPEPPVLEPTLADWKDKLGDAAYTFDFDKTITDEVMFDDSGIWSTDGTTDNQGDVWQRTEGSDEKTVLQIRNGKSATLTKAPADIYYYTYNLFNNGVNTVKLEGITDNVIKEFSANKAYTQYTTVVDTTEGKVYTYEGTDTTAQPITVNTIGESETVTGITFASGTGYMYLDSFAYGLKKGATDPNPYKPGGDNPDPSPEPSDEPINVESKLSDWDLTEPTHAEEFDGKSIAKLQEDDWKFGNTNAGANFNEKHVIINGSGELEVNWYGTATYGKTDEENSYYYTYTVKTKDLAGIRSVNLSGVDNSTMLVSGKEITSSDRTFTTVVDVNSKKAYTYDNATGDFVSVVDVPNPAAVKGITFSGGTVNTSVGMQVDNVSYGLVNVTPPEKPVTIVLKGDKVNDGETLENGQTYEVTGEKFTETVIKLDEPYTVKDEKTLLFMTNSIVITPPSTANGNIVVDGTKITALEALTAGIYNIDVAVASSYKGEVYGSETYTIIFTKPTVTDTDIENEYEPVITTETVDGKEVTVNTDNTAPTEIYNDLELPTETSFADITWTSDTPSVISNDGAIVKRPLTDTPVKLTAKIANKYNSGRVTEKEITVVVKGVGSMLDDAIAKAIAIVSADTDEKVDLTDLHEDIKIYTKYENNAYPEANEVTLEWNSDNDVLKINGGVAEIYPTTTDKYDVKLTVKATALGAEKTKDIDVTVHLTKAKAGDKYAVRCDDLVTANFSEIANLSGATVSSNISVPTTGLFGSTISWTSSVPMYMSNTGRYTAPTNNTNVTMTGIVSKGKVISDKKHAYSFTVKGKSNNQSGGGSGGGGGSSSGGRSSSYSLPMNTGSTTPITNNQPSNAGNYNPNANTQPEGFTDLGNVAWAEEAINALADKGIISGRSERIFDPDANITRAEFATIIVKAFGFEDTDAAVDEFADVNSDDWYYSFVAAAYNNGIISGYDNGSFGSYDNITRQDMAVIIYRAANAAGVELDEINEGKTFEDEAYIAAYAADAVDALVKAGVINGMTDTEFAPTANATRAQAAKMTYELVK